VLKSKYGDRVISRINKSLGENGQFYYYIWEMGYMMDMGLGSGGEIFLNEKTTVSRSLGLNWRG